jgi:hypothetical protein
MKMTMMAMTRGEGPDEEEAGAGGELCASGAGAKSTEGKDGNDDMEKVERKVKLEVCAPPARVLIEHRG